MTDAKRLPYLPALDGLRALAVTAVLVYHGEQRWLPGGFLGVEVFFVISGYLITSLLLAEWGERGQIDLKGFWLRRARRLLPAAFSLILASLVFAVVLLPGEVAGLRRDALAALAYATNWYLVLNHQSYFEAIGRPSLLQHLWSLAVEEQFYLLWPPLLTLGLARLGRRRVLPAVVVGALASSALMAALYRPGVDSSRLYYGTDTRAAGLLVGSALAFVWRPGQGRAIGRLWLELGGLAALGGLAYAALRLGEYQPLLYRGGFALVALLTAALIAVAVHPSARLAPAVLGRQPLRWIGLRSYGLYLWHWPVFTVTRPHLDVPLDGLPLLALRLAAAAALAELSYRLVEAPIRAGALGRSLAAGRAAWSSLAAARGGRRVWLGLRWLGASGALAGLTGALAVSVALAQAPTPPAYLAVSAVRTSAPRAGAAAATPGPASAVSGALQPAPASAAASAPAGQAELVTAVGDSVMVGAVAALQDRLGNVEVDAAVGRQVSTIIAVLQEYRDAGTLGSIVVVHGGTNGTFTSDEFDEMMEVLSGVRLVVFVNDKVPRGWEDSNNAVIADGVSRYPNAVLVDWYSTTTEEPEVLYDDGIHLRPEGATAYADLIAAAIGE